MWTCASCNSILPVKPRRQRVIQDGKISDTRELFCCFWCGHVGSIIEFYKRSRSITVTKVEPIDIQQSIHIEGCQAKVGECLQFAMELNEEDFNEFSNISSSLIYCDLGTYKSRISLKSLLYYHRHYMGKSVYGKAKSPDQRGWWVELVVNYRETRKQQLLRSFEEKYTT